MGRNSVVLVLVVLLIVLGATPVICATSMWNFGLQDYKNHVCNRPCLNYTAPKLCHYDFLVENYYVLSKACFDCPYNLSNCFLPQCVSAGGVRKVIKAVNRIFPGPSIQVCEGDTVEVTVTNMLDGAEGTTIHWHGILQKGTQFMDGVPMVTQCPVLMGSHFTYRFQAMDVGTYFWHGHAGTQRADGLFGSLIVRQSPNREPQIGLYDFDMPEHVIIVNDWLTTDSTDRLAELVHILENLHMTVLINGMGQFRPFVNETTNMTYYTPRASFTVMPGMRYRFRVINSGIINCPLLFSIDNHTLTIIASDGSPVKPLMRNSFTIHAGERYDFVLTAHNTTSPRNYWIRVGGLESCNTYNVSQAAVLMYQDAPNQLPPEPLTYESATEVPATGNASAMDVTVVEQLVSIAGSDDIVTAKPDKKFYLHVDMVNAENLRSYNPPYYTVMNSALFQSPMINSITSVLPNAPPLTQLSDIPEADFCNAESLQNDCDEEWCTCIHRYQIDVGDLVELLILDDDAYHPMHLHGYKFRVVGWGKLPDGTPISTLQQMDANGQLYRMNASAAIKDTVAAPIGGYYILRFRADNPGFWLFHCHLEFHMETGMMLIFQVGNSTTLPRKPRNFPTCGSFDFTGYESDEDNMETCNRDTTCNCNCTFNGVCVTTTVKSGNTGVVASTLFVILTLTVALMC